MERMGRRGVDLTERLARVPLIFDAVKPARFTKLARTLDTDCRLKILDVGCGQVSPVLFRRQFRNADYTGLDFVDFPASSPASLAANRLLKVDLEAATEDQLPRGPFDLVMLAHVLEHLRDPLKILRWSVQVVRPRGIVYVAYPAEDSSQFPSRRGTLNFYDDPTHRTVVRTSEVCGALVGSGCTIVETGRSRTARGILVAPLRVLVAPLTGGVTGPMLWELYGFEAYAIGRKRPAIEPRRPSDGQTLARGASRDRGPVC